MSDLLVCCRVKILFFLDLMKMWLLGVMNGEEKSLFFFVGKNIKIKG